jgi:hypothetical protein
MCDRWLYCLSLYLSLSLWLLSLIVCRVHRAGKGRDSRTGLGPPWRSDGRELRTASRNVIACCLASSRIIISTASSLCLLLGFIGHAQELQCTWYPDSQQLLSLMQLDGRYMNHAGTGTKRSPLRCSRWWGSPRSTTQQRSFLALAARWWACAVATTVNATSRRCGRSTRKRCDIHYDCCWRSRRCMRVASTALDPA